MGEVSGVSKDYCEKMFGNPSQYRIPIKEIEVTLI